MEKSFS